MNQPAWLLLALAAAAAAVDWIAVAHQRRSIRWPSKPAVMLLLVGVALTLDPASAVKREIFVAALLLSLLGDLFLLADGGTWFMAGLAAFLGAHLAYIGGFLAGGVHPDLLLGTLSLVGIISVVVGGLILRALQAQGRQRLIAAVVSYMLAISVMVACAWATATPAALVGAALFYLSDSLIAWNRFVDPLPAARLPIIATYHLGQLLLVLSLAR